MSYFNTFYRALHVKLSDEYLARLGSTGCSVLNPDDVYDHKVVISTVGTTSYTVTATHGIREGLPIATSDHVLVTIDTKNRKSSNLDPKWKANATSYIKQSGIVKDPVHIPDIPEVKTVLSRELEVVDEYIDHNKHTNLKIYMLGSYAAIQAAVRNGTLTLRCGGTPVDYDQVVINEFVAVFEQETNIKDILRFDILGETGRDELFVLCYKENKRVAYCQLKYIGM